MSEPQRVARVLGNLRVPAALRRAGACDGGDILVPSKERGDPPGGEGAHLADRADRTVAYLIDAVTDHAIYMLDANGVVSSWNTGARRLKGYEAAEIEGRHFSQFFTPEDRAAGVPARILATAAAEGRSESEGWRLRKDGSRFWARGAVHRPGRNRSPDRIRQDHARHD